MIRQARLTTSFQKRSDWGVNLAIMSWLFGILFAPNIFAQMVVRESIASPENVRTGANSERYNFRVGPVKIRVDVGASTEFNDNINLQKGNAAASDFIFRPGLQFNVIWPVSQQNELKLNMGTSVAKYLSHPDLDSDGMLISPDSQLDFTLYVSDFRIQFVDAFSSQADPVASPELSQKSTFKRFSNSAGVTTDWDLNAVIITFGLQDQQLVSMESAFDSVTRQTDTVSLAPKFLLSPTLGAGLNTSYSMTNYKSKVQNDGRNIQVGPFAEAALTERTQVRAELGYQIFEFDQTGDIGDSSRASAPYGVAGVKNKLNDVLTHSLMVSRRAELAIGSNFIDRYAVDYQMMWNLIKDYQLSTGLFYDYYATSGTAKEEANRYGATVRIGHQLTPSTQISLEQKATLKDSTISSNNYLQNATLLSMSYGF